MQPNILDQVLPNMVNVKNRTLIEINSSEGQLFFRAKPSAKKEETGIFKESRQLCQKIYSQLYPDYAVSEEEPYDNRCCIFYSRSGGQINSMMRICFDSSYGLPAQPSLESEISALRACGVRLAEPGRFVIENIQGLYSKYLRAAYQLAVLTQVDAYILQVRNEHVHFYRRYCGAVSLNSSAAPSGCTNLCWSIENTHQRFFKAFGVDQSNLEKCLMNVETNNEFA